MVFIDLCIHLVSQVKKRHSFMGIANSEMGGATVDTNPLGGGSGRDDM